MKKSIEIKITNKSQRIDITKLKKQEKHSNTQGNEKNSEKNGIENTQSN